MKASWDTSALEEALGPDLAALVAARGGLARLQEITTLPSPSRRRGAFLLEFANGERLKGCRLPSPERAEAVERLGQVIGSSYSRILARRGDALLLEWVEGRSLDSLEDVPGGLVRRCGEMLGALHTCRTEDASEADSASPELLLGKLDRHRDLLCREGRLEKRLAARAREAAAAAQPRRPALGIIHKDFCAANLVSGDGGELVCVDNDSLTLGPLDLDLARTWQRWPMARGERAEFVAGYEKHRSLASLLEHFAFWAVFVLVWAAATRLRLGADGVRESIDRLERLLDLADAGRAEEAFWAA